MGNIKLAGRYAKSLMDLAAEKNAIEAVFTDAKLFNNIAADREFFVVMKSPVIKADKKIAIFNTLFAASMNELTMAFFRIVITKGREAFLRDIMIEFVAQYNERKGIMPVQFTSASPVDEKVINTLKSMLQSQLNLKEVEITNSVDEKLIGGFTLEFNNQLIDASILHDLNAIRSQFTSNEYNKQF